MKKLSYLFPVILLLALPACNDFHDNIQPADGLPIDAAYNTAADLESALNGVYNALQSESIAGPNFLMMPEIMGGNLIFNASGGAPELLDLSNRDLRSSNFYATGFWIAAYKAINLSNAILGALNTVQDAALTPDVKKRIEGEALFIRGFLYFELARYYGKVWGDNSSENGVPIILEAVLQKGEMSFPARASLLAVYDQAASDLGKARDMLPATQGYDRANPTAAKALLAKMAFQKGDYPLAASLAKEVIENYGYQLTETPKDFFLNENSTEIIWAVKFTPSDGNTTFLYFHESFDFIAITGEMKAAFASIATPAQKAAVQAEGLSIADLRSTPPLVSADTNFTNKYEDITTRADDAPMARLAEFILMRAEALARTGDLPGAVDLLNQIRARSLRVLDANGNDVPGKQGLVLFTPADFTDADALIEAIIRERRVELCFERNYFQDMIRLQRSIGGLAYDNCRLRLPIPQREIDVNKNLKQNGDCY